MRGHWGLCVDHPDHGLGDVRYSVGHRRLHGQANRAARIAHRRPLPGLELSHWVGLTMTIAGLGFAVWARVTLGRNWSAMVTVKQDHELIRTGPYALVRHPIYTGLAGAVLGTSNVRW